MLDFINKYIIGNSIPVVLILTGVYFVFYMSGRPIFQPLRVMKLMLRRGKGASEGASGKISPFRSMSMALAGTLGVGNIVGVAGAIALGGFGAIFWMWVTALAAMILKYAEIVLAMVYRRIDGDGGRHGGAVYYIKGILCRLGLPRFGRFLAAVFGVLCILNSLSMGCIVQVNAVSSAMNGVLSIPRWAVGLLLLALSIPVIAKGSGSISALTEWLVPLMSAGYIIISVIVMVACRERIPQAMRLVISEAFNLGSVGGGVLGFLASDALRYGSMRGLLSNEAGCGTAPFAHATSRVDEPAEQGVWGIFEVFADTILLCTMTAAVIILNYESCVAYSSDGVMMTVRAFSAVLGDGAGYFLCSAVFLFAYATVICWAQYGIECVDYLMANAAEKVKRAGRWGYILIFSACIPVGSLVSPSSVWSLADFSIGSMTLINLFVLCLGASEIRHYTYRVFKKRASPEGEAEQSF